MYTIKILIELLVVVVDMLYLETKDTMVYLRSELLQGVVDRVQVQLKEIIISIVQADLVLIFH